MKTTEKSTPYEPNERRSMKMNTVEQLISCTPLKSNTKELKQKDQNFEEDEDTVVIAYLVTGQTIVGKMSGSSNVIKNPCIIRYQLQQGAPHVIDEKNKENVKLTIQSFFSPLPVVDAYIIKDKIVCLGEAPQKIKELYAHHTSKLYLPSTEIAPAFPLRK